MKKLLTVITVLAVFISAANAQAGKPFTLSGKLTGNAAGKLFLYYTNAASTRVTDSTTVNAGAFAFKGIINEPTNAWLVGGKARSMDEGNSTSLFLEPGMMTIKLAAGNFKDAVITGSKSQAEAEGLAKLTKPVYDDTKPLSEAYRKASEAVRAAEKEKQPDAIIDTLKYRAAAVHEQFEPYWKKVEQINYDFFVAHPNSYVTASNLRFYTGKWSLDTLQQFYDRMNPALKSSSYGKDLLKEIGKLRAGSPGAVAANFSAKDINGNMVSLSDYKGKVILIDFWASWCVPCRKSMPHVKELYAKYKDSGMQVIAIADDDNNHDAWKKAVEKDGTGLWPNLLRGLDWDKINKGEPNPGDISEKFGIHSLPTKILIGRDGKIIGRYEENEEALDKKLAEVFQ